MMPPSETPPRSSLDRGRRRPPAWLLLVLVLLASAPSLLAQGEHWTIDLERNRDLLQDFDRRIQELDQLLVKGKARKAYHGADRLLQEMQDTIISGTEVPRLLGTATLMRAVAAYQRGREDEALWHWHVATQMYPQSSEVRLQAYGGAGDFLKSHPLPERGDDPDLTEEEMRSFEPPRKKFGPQPDVPDAKRGSGSITVTVEAVIDVDGSLKQPRIVESQGELTLVYSALDTLREWRFEPAKIDGEPVEVYYRLKINFVV